MNKPTFKLDRRASIIYVFTKESFEIHSDLFQTDFYNDFWKCQDGGERYIMLSTYCNELYTYLKQLDPEMNISSNYEETRALIEKLYPDTDFLLLNKFVSNTLIYNEQLELEGVKND